MAPGGESVFTPFGETCWADAVTANKKRVLSMRARFIMSFSPGVNRPTVSVRDIVVQDHGVPLECAGAERKLRALPNRRQKTRFSQRSRLKQFRGGGFLNGLQFSYESGYPSLGGRTLYPRFSRGFTTGINEATPAALRSRVFLPYPSASTSRAPAVRCLKSAGGSLPASRKARWIASTFGLKIVLRFSRAQSFEPRVVSVDPWKRG